MQFTETSDGLYVATDREARSYIVEKLGKKISGTLTREEISEDDMLTGMNLEIIRADQARRMQEFSETIRK